MRYFCTACSYIYDESLGDKEENISPGTSFESLGDVFVCPVCGETKDAFHEIKEEVNYLDDSETKDFLELDHFINLYIEDDLIEVSIGKDTHPSGEEHRITEISLYDEYGDLVESKFFKAGEIPEAQFDISTLDDFELRARCSVHGVWGRKIEI